MKILLTTLLLAVFSAVCFAQDASTETNFEKNKKKYKVAFATVGEDASSGFDYVVYKDGDKVVMLRSIWSSSAGPMPRVRDFYFENGKLVLFVASTFSKRSVKRAAKGGAVKLTIEEKLWFKDDKLIAWTEKGKTVEKTDARWKEMETDAVAWAKDELESFKLETEN